MSASYRELLGIDEEPIEFEWNIIPGFSSLQILQKIHNDLRERNIEPEKFTDWIIRQHFSCGKLCVRMHLDCFKMQIL